MCFAKFYPVFLDFQIDKITGKNPLRAMRNLAAEKVLEMEQKGATLEELMPVISGNRARRHWKKAIWMKAYWPWDKLPG